MLLPSVFEYLDQSNCNIFDYLYTVIIFDTFRNVKWFLFDRNTFIIYQENCFRKGDGATKHNRALQCQRVHCCSPRTSPPAASPSHPHLSKNYTQKNKQKGMGITSYSHTPLFNLVPILKKTSFPLLEILHHELFKKLGNLYFRCISILAQASLLKKRALREMILSCRLKRILIGPFQLLSYLFQKTLLCSRLQCIRRFQMPDQKRGKRIVKGLVRL